MIKKLLIMFVLVALPAQAIVAAARTLSVPCQHCTDVSGNAGSGCPHSVADKAQQQCQSGDCADQCIGHCGINMALIANAGVPVVYGVVAVRAFFTAVSIPSVAANGPERPPRNFSA